MANNKMREALTKILNLTNSLDEDCAVDPVDICDIARDALAEPPRNCDVGSVDDQKDRFLEFCDDEKGHRDHCRNCRLCNSSDCELAWAQMPYVDKEGGAE